MAHGYRRAATAFAMLLAGVIAFSASADGSARDDPAAADSPSIDADSGARVADLCARAFAFFRHDAINFEESTTTLRSSAHPVLDRIISLADACRESTVVITGHSDSSGDEASNLQLSLDRAQAVADYLTRRGISPDRLSVAGAGSSSPVADNATRYGRSLNRRIEVAFRYGGAKPGS